MGVKCPECNKSYSSQNSLRIHMKIHTGYKRFECEFEGCDYKSIRFGDLKRHMRTHTGSKPFSCKFEGCYYKCTQSGNLKRHMRIHTGSKPFSCEFEGCDYKCIRSGDLKTHVMTHIGDKRFECEIEGCDYKCIRSGDLKRHMRTHTGSKPFSCEFEGCEYKCTQSGNLKKHMRTHTGSKPFSCEIEGCDFKCTRSENLKRHMRTHTGEKRFECEFGGCESKFTSSVNLKKHLKCMHTKEGQQRQKKTENHVMKYLDSVGIDYDREVPISYSCIDDTSRNSSRIDAVIDCPERDLRILLEVDEDQHAGNPINCELARMTDSTACIRLGGETRKLLWLRFNPDAYKVDGSTVKTFKKDRYKVLEDVIGTHIPQKDMEVMYLYYSTQDGVPCVMSDVDYSDSFKDFVIFQK